MKLHLLMLKEFNEWFDRLPEPTRFIFFLTALMGWLVPLFLSDLIRPHNEIVGVALGVFGGCWLFVTGIIALERAFGSKVRND